MGFRHDDDDDDKPLRRTYRLKNKRRLPTPWVEDDEDNIEEEDEDDDEDDDNKLHYHRGDEDEGEDDDEDGTFRDPRYYRREQVRARAPVDDDPLDHDNPLLTLLDLYSNLNFYAEKQRDYHKRLDTLLLKYPELRALWSKFHRVGGCTTKDLEDFLNGRFRPRIVRQRKHLRLIASRKAPPIRLIKPGGEAA